ncbi:MAG: hypothetical protein DHS20C05_07940 [Hyphococcus sp.]|nr:MAG: hypothetical protein DHS20C05_07940 [Marinicaulis sp.]
MTTTKETASESNPFEAFTFASPDTFKQGYEKFAEGVSAFTDFQKGAFEAMTASTSAFTKGVEKLTSEQAAFTKSFYENGIATAKAASASKSAQEALDINTEYFRDVVEQNLGQANKVAEIWMETTKQTVEPLTVRYSELVEKIQSFRP